LETNFGSKRDLASKILREERKLANMDYLELLTRKNKKNKIKTVNKTKLKYSLHKPPKSFDNKK
jgi:hypothetical protein